MAGNADTVHSRHEDRNPLGNAEQSEITTAATATSTATLTLIECPEDVPKLSGILQRIAKRLGTPLESPSAIFWYVSSIWNRSDNPQQLTVEEAFIILNEALSCCKDPALSIRILELIDDIVYNQADSAS